MKCLKYWICGLHPSSSTVGPKPCSSRTLVPHELGQGVPPFKLSDGSHFSLAQNKITDRSFSILHTSHNPLRKFHFSFSVGESIVIIKNQSQHSSGVTHFQTSWIKYGYFWNVICVLISLDVCLTSAHTVGRMSFPFSIQEFICHRLVAVKSQHSGSKK